jgi:hypothetical protein
MKSIRMFADLINARGRLAWLEMRLSQDGHRALRSHGGNAREAAAGGDEHIGVEEMGQRLAYGHVRHESRRWTEQGGQESEAQGRLTLTPEASLQVLGEEVVPDRAYAGAHLASARGGQERKPTAAARDPSAGHPWLTTSSTRHLTRRKYALRPPWKVTSPVRRCHAMLTAPGAKMSFFRYGLMAWTRVNPF